MLRSALVESKERADSAQRRRPCTSVVFGRDGRRAARERRQIRHGLRRGRVRLPHAYQAAQGPVPPPVISPTGHSWSSPQATDGTARVLATAERYRCCGRWTTARPGDGCVVQPRRSSAFIQPLNRERAASVADLDGGGTMVRALPHPGPVIGVLVFSRDGHQVVTIGSDPDETDVRARIFDVESGRLVRELGRHGRYRGKLQPGRPPCRHRQHGSHGRGLAGSGWKAPAPVRRAQGRSDGCPVRGRRQARRHDELRRCDTRLGRTGRSGAWRSCSET